MILFKTHTDINSVIEAASSAIIDTQQASLVGFQVNAVVNSTAQTAATGVQAVGTLGGVTYTANVIPTGLDSLGNGYTVTYTTGATAGAEVVTVVGTDISVQIQSGVSTITQVRTAVNANVSAAALVTATGTSATVVTAVAKTAISAMATPTPGVDSKFVVATDLITISAHGFYTGLVVQATKSGAAFPTGILASTNYYVFVVDANTIALFDTLAHALAAANNGAVASAAGVINITADGTINTTITFTPVSVSGASYKLQKSADYDPRTGAGNWIDAVSGESNTVVTNNITVSANTVATMINNCWSYVRILFAISAGTMAIKVISNTKTR